MKQGATSKIKFKKLKRRLKIPEWQVIGLLQSIWDLTLSSAQEGDIGRHSNEDIAAAIEYFDDADEMIKALVDCGWLDEDEQFRLIVHDWSDHVPAYTKGNFATHKREFADVVAKRRKKLPVIGEKEDRPADEVRQRVLDRDQVCQYCGGEAETIDHIVPKIRGGGHEETNLVASCFSCNDKKGTLSVDEFARQPFCPGYFVLGRENGTVNALLMDNSELLSGPLGGVLPIQSNPIQVNSSQTNPQGRSGRIRTVAVRLASKLTACDRIKDALSQDEIWEVAWVSALLDEEIVYDLVRRIAQPKGKEVVKVGSYVRRTMKNQCRQRERDWLKLRESVGIEPADARHEKAEKQEAAAQQELDQRIAEDRQLEERFGSVLDGMSKEEFYQFAERVLSEFSLSRVRKDRTKCRWELLRALETENGK